MFFCSSASTGLLKTIKFCLHCNSHCSSISMNLFNFLGSADLLRQWAQTLVRCQTLLLAAVLTAQCCPPQMEWEAALSPSAWRAQRPGCCCQCHCLRNCLELPGHLESPQGGSVTVARDAPSMAALTFPLVTPRLSTDTSKQGSGSSQSPRLRHSIMCLQKLRNLSGNVGSKRMIEAVKAGKSRL